MMSSLSTFPTVLRQLLRTHQAFLAYAAKHVNQLDLTLPQYDVIITLGNTAGMQSKVLGEKTLITKGTLTGVVSRLEDKGLVERSASKKDGRSQIIRLTEAGRAIYEASFPEHLVYLNKLFDDYTPEQVAQLEAELLRLQQAVITARGDGIDDSADDVFELLR
jgi:MarR family transcriptional regulator, organic hydroperoxide resistance regulator